MSEETQRIAVLLELKNEEFKRNARTAETAITRLERKFDPLQAAETRLEKQQRKLNAALEAGTLDAKRHAQGMDLLQREFEQTSARAAGVKNNVVAMNGAVAAQTGFMTRNRAIFQQGGYQVGDFAVQVQGGTSALTAFTQQGSQLLGVFGPWGAVMGAVLAVGAPLASVFLRNTDAGMKFEEALEGIREVSETLSDPLNALKMTNQELTDLYGDAADKVRELIGVQAQLRVAMAEDALQGYVMALDGVIGKYTTAATGSNALRNTLLRIQRDFDLTREQAVSFEAALQSLETAGTLEAQKAALQDILAFLEANNISVQKMPPAIQEALDQMIDLSNESDRAAQIAAELEASDFGASSISVAAGEATRLSQNLSTALDLAQRMAGYNTGANNNGLDEMDPRNPNNKRAGAWTGGYGRTSPFDRVSTKTSGRKSGGRSSGGSGRTQTSIFDLAEKEIANFNRQIEMIGKSRSEIAALTAKYKLMDEAKRRGLDLTEELTEKIEAEAAEVGSLAEKYDQARDKVAAMEKIQASFKDSVIDAAMGGENAMDAFTDSIKRAAIEYLAFGSGPFSQMLSGGGSFKGVLGNVFGGLLSFDGGGSTGSGPRSGGVDGRGGFPAILHPNETVVDHTKGQKMGGGAVEIVVRNEPGVVVEIARNEAGAVVREAAPQIINQAVQQTGRAMQSTKTFGSP